MATIRTGPAPYGYKREEGRLALVPDEVSVIQYIFELFVKHERRKIVCDILYAEKKTTRSGSSFTSPSVTRILENKYVLGIDGEAEQIISDNLWKKCQLILQSQEGKGGAPRKPTNLFAGITHCGCGQKMRVPTNTATKKYVCSDCTTKIPSDALEEIFVAQLESYPLPEVIRPRGQTLLDVWTGLEDFEQKRKLVESITKRIDVTENKVTCSLILL
ncbi:recombinase family protein [Kordiimonas pumila]|uniref:Recombinase family protein n=1 Tax=Kordiimonas pumila TaxID=2161677 RepID=A0ABV7D7W8_9PROT|nr:recombinase family protein [Kordiimonas pumila]